MIESSKPLPTSKGRLRRELSVWEAIGVSVALMAPSMGVNINPQGTAGLVGSAVPLTFLLGTAAVLLVAYTFVRLCQRFSHSGSVYGFVGATLGPKAGAFSGWALAGTYIFYAIVTTAAAGIFVGNLIRTSGLWADAPDWIAFPVAAVLLLLVAFVATRPARGGTRLLLLVEVLTVGLILFVIVVVTVRLLTHTAPRDLSFDPSVLSLSAEADPSMLFLGVVFAFLSFAGFEAAATLGEEAKNPRKDIPRAILGTAAFGGIFFVLVTAIQVMGFGADAEGMNAFTSSGSLTGDLAVAYISPIVGTIITIGAAVSAVGCALACVVGASRLIFALSRDGLGPTALGNVDEHHGVPQRAALAASAGVLVAILIAWLAVGSQPSELFTTSGTAGTLILLVAYILATLGALYLLFISKKAPRTVKRWEVAIPVAALVVLAYTVFRNIVPLPVGAALWGPALALGWLVINLIVVLARGKAAREAGTLLMQADGIGPDNEAPVRASRSSMEATVGGDHA
ncbi:APC family permease [Paenarthrobacter ureafaciens]|uniref:APC family permease n=1 Tax=Paenarthrobacter ureafaciens TaxID=37931 RepID=UPI0015B95D58|nr:APC family permease [Paenarthrobacter ureafaciens]NWL26626.1 APC family permease [Paenarthrobacter ureafaciens]